MHACSLFQSRWPNCITNSGWRDDRSAPLQFDVGDVNSTAVATGGGAARISAGWTPNELPTPRDATGHTTPTSAAAALSAYSGEPTSTVAEDKLTEDLRLWLRRWTELDGASKPSAAQPAATALALASPEEFRVFCAQLEAATLGDNEVALICTEVAGLEVAT